MDSSFPEEIPLQREKSWLVRFGILDFFSQRRNDLKKVADHSQIRHAENRCLGILIDCHYVL